MAGEGLFDPDLVGSSWFDETATVKGWFDADLIAKPAAGGKVDYTLTCAAGAYVC